MATKARVMIHFAGQPPEKRYWEGAGDVTSGTPLELTDADSKGIAKHIGKTVDMVCCEGETGIKFGGIREGTTVQVRTFPGGSVVGAGIAKWMPIKPHVVTESTAIYADVPA